MPIPILFTKFTFLFTIQILPAEGYQSNFIKSKSGRITKIQNHEMHTLIYFVPGVCFEFNIKIVAKNKD